MTGKKNPFFNEGYKADRNILRNACQQHAFYLSKLLDKPKEEIYNNLATYIKSHDYPSRIAKVIIKDKVGDRELKNIKLSSILNHAEQKDYHLSPSMVGYTNSDKEESINAIGTRIFSKNRNDYKVLRKKATNDPDLYEKYDKLQNAFKLFNNAGSGAMSSEGTPVNNKSGHTTLTSTGRLIVSVTNLTNEQFIAGNRFYNSPQNTLQSITAKVINTDMKALELVMDKYKLYYPEPKDLMKIVKHCSFRYWESIEYMKIIEEFVYSLKPIEIAAVMYNLDLITLYEYNRAFITTFFDDWVHIPTDYPKESKPDDGDKYTLALSKLLKDASDQEINQLNAYHEDIQEKYADFIEQFFHSTIPPTDIYDVNTAVRDCVLTSDTDSSIYTTSRVMTEYTKDKEKGMRLNMVLTYFIRMISIDQHYQASINLNIAKKNQHMLSMKNEIYFSGYVTTIMSKHYYALERIKEGVLLNEPALLTKGVHLRSSKIAGDIKDIAKELMEEIILKLENNEKLNPADILYKVAELERVIFNDLKEGKWKWLAKATVRGEKAYAKPMSSAYFNHVLWEKVFGFKYGKAPELPYLGIKVSVDLGNKTKIEEYISQIEDKQLATYFKAFCEEHGKEGLNNIIFPAEVLNSIQKLPNEIIPVINYRSIIKQNLKSIYAVLESTGLYFINESISRLVSDEH